MKSAKLSLLNLHISCMLIDWGLTVLSVPFLILPVMGGYPLGILTSWFGVSPLIQTYLVITFIFAGIPSIMLIFENRYFQLYARESSWRHTRIPFMIFNYIMALTHLIPACLLVPDQQIALDYTYKHIPNLPEDIRRLPLFILAIEYGALIPFNVVSVIMSAESYLFIRLINRNMNQTSRRMSISGNTLKMQKTFLKAIHAQATVFILNAILPMSYVVVAIMTNYYNQAFNNLTFMVASTHGINSTLIMLWAHKPYREVCFSFWNGSNAVASSRMRRLKVSSVIVA